jgi:hypothetical protein
VSADNPAPRLPHHWNGADIQASYQSKVGARLPDEVEIFEGLEPVENVAVTNLVRLTPGMKVKAQNDAPPKS